jgi:hypothetical protein
MVAKIKLIKAESSQHMVAKIKLAKAESSQHMVAKILILQMPLTCNRSSLKGLKNEVAKDCVI